MQCALTQKAERLTLKDVDSDSSEIRALLKSRDSLQYLTRKAADAGRKKF